MDTNAHARLEVHFEFLSPYINVRLFKAAWGTFEIKRNQLNKCFPSVKQHMTKQ